MALFLSTYTNKVDKKGRVSVPKSFRSTVEESSLNGIIIYHPYRLNCIEGADIEFIEKLSDRIYSDVSPFDDDELSVGTAIISESRPLSFDPEGRVTLPEDLRALANITHYATFAGIGKKFQIWNPDDHLAHIKLQRANAAARATQMSPLLSGGR